METILVNQIVESQVNAKANQCGKRVGKVHLYRIIKGSGAMTGTPKWRCIFCKKTVISN